MNVSVRGNNLLLNKREIRYCINFFTAALLGTRLSNNIKIEVKNSDQDSKYWGLIYPVEKEPSNKAPRWFSMTLFQSSQRKKAITTLAHECTHLKQFARSELRIPKPDTYIWKGEKFTVGQNIDKESYRSLPWEAEANMLEDILTEEYDNHLRVNSIQF